MSQRILVVADHHSWVTGWEGPKAQFEEATPELLAGFSDIVLAPGDQKYQATCEEIFDWKRGGRIGETRLFLATYKGRHLWSPENDSVVERWAVHANSEREALDSDRLYFIPLCVMPPRKVLTAGDNGYAFLGGRKWRRIDIGVEAISRSGVPGRVITDFAPEGNFPGVEIHRERIPKKDYIDVMERARIVLVPLHGTPVSHGQVDVVTAVSVGKPVLVTAGASCDDYVKHGVNGLLVVNNSVEAWVDAIHEAWERADDFAAAAREMAPLYDSARYGGYVRDMVADPDKLKVPREAGVPDPRHERGEFVESLKRASHQATMKVLNEFVRERKFVEALELVDECLDGPFRGAALKIKMRALTRVDPAKAEEVSRLVIAEVDDDAEARSCLATALLQTGNLQAAVVEARKAVELDPARVASRITLVTTLRQSGDLTEALNVLEAGLAKSPDDAGLQRLKNKIGTRSN